jgi:hypothetical protein
MPSKTENIDHIRDRITLVECAGSQHRHPGGPCATASIRRPDAGRGFDQDALDHRWEPVIPFEQTLRDLLQYWRDRVRAMPASAH